MPRVGFRGLKAYRLSAMAELDKAADELASEIDKVKAEGSEAIQSHHKSLDSERAEIDDLKAMVREGSNGGPLPA